VKEGITAAVIAFILIVCGIVIGAGGSWIWQYSEINKAQTEKIAALGERDRLVEELADAKAQRDRAQIMAQQQRQAIYDDDEEARDWAAKPVPGRLAERVRDGARATDAAARAASAPALHDDPRIPD